MSLLLLGLGFATMAEEVKKEEDHARLCRYARIIVKNAPEAQKQELASRFRLLRLM